MFQMATNSKASQDIVIQMPICNTVFVDRSKLYMSSGDVNYWL